MTDSLVSSAPFTPVKPLIKVTNGGNSVEFECAAGDLAVEVDQDEKTTETFCGTYTTYKAEVWTITASVFQSYGATGLWNLLRPYVGQTCTFEVRPTQSAGASADNPSMTGTCIVKAFPFYEGSPGEPKNFDVVLAVQGTPTFSAP